ncbi:MAG: hypothetical protein Q8M02_03665 [Candidatus Didemnitutus sp.]|nr:hypothetical protein [Candidatus Didemnitutus sp.]
MKTRSLLLSLCAFGALCAALPAARAANLHAVLITASNESGPTDPRLANYEVTLRRVLRFKSYTYQGSDSTRTEKQRSSELIIGQGHELQVETGDDPLSLRIRWSSGSRTLMNTGLTLRAGVPAVLGGPRTGKAEGEVYAVILVAR